MLSILLISMVYGILGCQLASQDIGFCATKDNLGSQSFCYASVQDTICMPVQSITWSAYDISYRDQAIENIFISNMGSQLLDEYVHNNVSTLIISNNRVCYDAYKQFLCQFNFPKCNEATNITQPICKTVCTNFFEQCLNSSQACDIIYSNMFPGLDDSC